MYNPRRNIFGTMPLPGKIAYHLFNVNEGATKKNDIIKLVQKSKWHAQHTILNQSTLIEAETLKFMNLSRK